jgi:hypothetical protein
MSPLRWTLVALLVASTAVFAVGVITERSSTDTHNEPSASHAAESGGGSGEPEGAHNESGESSATGAGETARAETSAESGAAGAESERLLGIDVESTPLVILAVLAGLALAAFAASQIGLRPGFLLAVVVIGVAWAALDIREVVHQLDESRTGVAVIAIVVAALHLAVAAIGGRLATRAPATS